MANSVYPDQTAPIEAVCSGSTLFPSMPNWSVMLENYLQQTTFQNIPALPVFFSNFIIVLEIFLSSYVHVVFLALFFAFCGRALYKYCSIFQIQNFINEDCMTAEHFNLS